MHTPPSRKCRVYPYPPSFPGSPAPQSVRPTPLSGQPCTVPRTSRRGSTARRPQHGNSHLRVAGASRRSPLCATPRGWPLRWTEACADTRAAVTLTCDDDGFSVVSTSSPLSGSSALIAAAVLFADDASAVRFFAVWNVKQRSGSPSELAVRAPTSAGIPRAISASCLRFSRSRCRLGELPLAEPHRTSHCQLRIVEILRHQPQRFNRGIGFVATTPYITPRASNHHQSPAGFAALTAR